MSLNSHQSAKPVSVEYLTPPEIITALGPFDLDPCAPIVRPWPMAKRHLTIADNGLSHEWFGRVWLNPPWGRQMNPWLIRMAVSGNGIALLPARTDRADFHDHVFSVATSVLYVRGRISFYTTAGEKHKNDSGCAIMLIGYSENDSDVIADSRICGSHQPIRYMPIVVVGVSPTWKSVITISLTRLKGKATTQELYDLVQTIAPDKVRNNPNFKAKVRQQLQYFFDQVDRGYYKIREYEPARTTSTAKN